MNLAYQSADCFAVHRPVAVMQRLAERFCQRTVGLEEQWETGDNVSTGDLRAALQRYRSFLTDC
jgi:hypothetical protein